MPRRDALLAAAVAVVWGVNFVVIHVGLRTWPPLLFAALRFTLTAFPAVLLVPRPKGVDWRLVAGVGLFMSAGQFGFLFVGIDQGVPAGLASLVLQLQAAFTLLFAVVLLGERPGRRRLVGGLVAFGGIALIAADRSADHPTPLLPLGLVVVAAASWGLGNVCSRLAKAPDAVALLVWSSLVPPLPLAVASLVLEGPQEIGSAVADVGLSGGLAMAYVVGVSTFFGYTTWNGLLHRHPATSVAPFTLLVPVVGITAAWAFLGERPTPVELAGAAVVLAGLSRTVLPPDGWSPRVKSPGHPAGAPRTLRAGGSSNPTRTRRIATRWRTGRPPNFDHSP